MLTSSGGGRHHCEWNSAQLCAFIVAALTGASLGEAALDVAWVVLSWPNITEERLTSRIFSFGTLVHK